MKLLIRNVAIALASLSITGVAAASATVSNTGADSSNHINLRNRPLLTQTNDNTISPTNLNTQTALSGSVMARRNTSVGTRLGTGAAGVVSAASWADLNPATWQTNNSSFDSWWNGVANLVNGDLSSGWTGANGNWTPSGANWQNTWSNWDPSLWQTNGSTFNNWRTHVLAYLNVNRTTWQTNWTGTGSMGGTGTTTGTGAASGATSNSNLHSTGVQLADGSSTDPSALMNALVAPTVGDIAIDTTGPDSDNTVTLTNDPTITRTNINDVSIINNNEQTALSGNVTVSDNTSVSGVSSGQASNTNQADTTVIVSNY